MKQTLKITSSLLLVVLLVFSAVACANEKDATGLWKDATYTADATLGEGANTVTVEVTAEEKTVTFTVKTDKSTLGEALYDLELINNASFFDTCNGIKADWDADQAYWAFYVGEEYASFGVGDQKAVTTGEPVYKFVYTK